MSSQKIAQIVVLLAALFLIVLLILAPRLPEEAIKHTEAVAKVKTDPVGQKIAEAVALVQDGNNPMQGIMMLREILEEDPQRVEAHWHLAHFSVQSGQYEKAVERFEKVIELDEQGNYPDAPFYLGKTYATLNRNEDAILSFESYLKQVEDSTVKKRVEAFIIELKN
jgi:lipopolysaccharide biosynthesis regulator YciM